MGKKILAILAAIGGVFSAIFYVLFQQKKDEKKALEKDLEEVKEASENNENVINAQNEAVKTMNEGKKENEELKESASGNRLDNFNAACELLRK